PIGLKLRQNLAINRIKAGCDHVQSSCGICVSYSTAAGPRNNVSSSRNILCAPKAQAAMRASLADLYPAACKALGV
ncbi:hypothetical protein, partial [Leisingera sp. F5]|uniref:hypothetical protein n=1 Tax=Leisingera sp. F5 TaxID=1813816 RepID=UPI0025B99EEA